MKSVRVMKKPINPNQVANFPKDYSREIDSAFKVLFLHSAARNTCSTAALRKSNLGQFSQNSQRWTWATRTRAFGLIVSFIIFGHCLPVCGCRW